MHGIFQRARRRSTAAVQPVTDVEKPPKRRSGDIEVFSPEEVMALVRAAASEQDAAIYLADCSKGWARANRCRTGSERRPPSCPSYTASRSRDDSERRPRTWAASLPPRKSG